MNKEAMIAYLKRRGYDNLWGKGGVLVPLSRCSVSQLYAVMMREMEKERKRKLIKVVDKQLVFGF